MATGVLGRDHVRHGLGCGGWVADGVQEDWGLSRKVVVLVWGVQGWVVYWVNQAGHGVGGVAHGAGQEGQIIVVSSLDLGGGLVWHFERSRSWGGFRRSWKIFI